MAARTQIDTGIRAGLAGGAAFAIVMKLDMKLSGQPVDDFLLLAGFGPWRTQWRTIGPIVHSVNSVALGALYALVSARLRGPGWLRGMTFALVENAALWPILVLLDRVHPAIRSGELPEYNHPWPFLAEALRHAAYGLVLGAVYERLGRRPSRMAMLSATF